MGSQPLSSARPGSMEDPSLWEGQEALPSVESVHCACAWARFGLNIRLGCCSQGLGLVESLMWPGLFQQSFDVRILLTDGM